MQQSLEALNDAVTYGPDHDECWIARSRVRRELGDALGAQSDAEAALRIAPGNVAARDCIGRARSAQGLWSRALADFTAVLLRDPTRADVHRERAKCFEGLEMSDEAALDVALALRTEGVEGVGGNDGVFEARVTMVDLGER